MDSSRLQQPASAQSRRAKASRISAVLQIGWATISRPVGMISSLLMVFLILGEFLSPTARRVSMAYPLTRSLIISFITLAFTASVINQVINKRLQRRWERVRSIAMQGLNDELRIARDLLYIIQY